jgi:hypothetical protein
MFSYIITLYAIANTIFNPKDNLPNYNSYMSQSSIAPRQIQQINCHGRGETIYPKCHVAPF